MRLYIAPYKPTDQEQEDVIRARILMIRRAPFFGNLLMNMPLVYVGPEDATVPTAATDGKYVFVNVGFFAKILEDERVFVMVHELEHAIFDHAGSDSRIGDRDPRQWNIAADYVVNQMAVDAKIGTIVTSNGFRCYQNDKYRGWSVEQVYDDLSSQTQSQTQCGGGQVLDKHFATGAAQPDGSGGYVIRDNVPSAEAESTRRDLRATVVSTAKSVKSTHKTASEAGLPEAIERMIDEWLTPQFDWRELLPTRITALFREDYTYSRISKKTWATGVFYPGTADGTTVKIAIGFDMSGSISDEEGALFIAELHGIVTMFDSYEIHVWCYSDHIIKDSYRVFTPDDIEEIRGYRPTGTGGTLFDVNYNFMKENEILPDIFINFTDGMPFGSWGDPDYVDTMFVLTTDARPPFGSYAYFKP